MDPRPWVPGETERSYNESVPDQGPGYVCFDRNNVQTALHRGNGVEICDLLSPDNDLVVKRAKGSDALSRFFSQALVAVQTLRHSPEARERFAEKVAEARKGRSLLRTTGLQRSSSRSSRSTARASPPTPFSCSLRSPWYRRRGCSKRGVFR
ncbi:TIGR04141 family sporadically distributed protein [Streptomyces spiralis]|uniref:TIGR04141 family sporadically distributed protein n=1 Tax=Streptomyces spiralis TaxID=66376 RepID=UPI003695A983